MSLSIYHKKQLKERYKMSNALREWYGSRRSVSEISAYLPKEETLSSSLDKIIKKIPEAHNVKLGVIEEHWEEIAGADIAKNAYPISLEKGWLVIQVVNSGWLFQMNQLKRQIKQKIDRKCGKGFCSNLRFQIAQN